MKGWHKNMNNSVIYSMLLVVMIPHCSERIIKRFRAKNRIVPFLIRMVKEKSLNGRFLLRVLKALHIYKRQCFLK